jgi:hypothetical protein
MIMIMIGIRIVLDMDLQGNSFAKAACGLPNEDDNSVQYNFVPPAG